jgi:hypothetical protein
MSRRRSRMHRVARANRYGSVEKNGTVIVWVSTDLEREYF